MKNKKNLIIFGIMILAVIFLSWVIPASTSGTNGLELGAITPTGYADIFASLEVVLTWFAKPALFMLFIGMFYGVINKTGSYRALVSIIAKLFKQNKLLFAILTVLFYTATTALTGMYVPMFFFVPFSISVLTELKYSKLPSLLATVGATTIGLTAELSSSVISSMTGVEANTYIWIKLGLLVVLTALTVIYIWKMPKPKKSKTDNDSNELMYVPEKRNAIKEADSKGTSLLVVLILTFVVFVLGMKAWNTTVFSTFYTNIQNIKIEKFAIFDAILGSFEIFGKWTYNSLYATISLAIIVMSIANKLKFSEMIESAIEGAKKAIHLAILTGLISLVVIFTLNSGFIPTIVNLLAKGGNIVLTTISMFISAPFMVEESYAAQYLLQIVYTISADKKMLELYGLIIQIAYGFVMLIAPSSILLMVGLNYVEEDYTKWFKYIWKFLVVVFAACLIAITISILI